MEGQSDSAVPRLTTILWIRLTQEPLQQGCRKRKIGSIYDPRGVKGCNFYRVDFVNTVHVLQVCVCRERRYTLAIEDRSIIAGMHVAKAEAVLTWLERFLDFWLADEVDGRRTIIEHARGAVLNP